MIPALVEATLHSSIAVTVADNLSILRIGHGSARVAALAPLLSIAVPRLVLIKDRFQFLAAGEFIESTAHPMTLLEELQARILATISSGTESGPIVAHIQAAITSQAEEQTFSALNSAPDPRATEPDSSITEGI